MWVLGVGHSHPEYAITDELLVELQPALRQDSVLAGVGITHRRSSIPSDYLAQTGNEDLRKTLPLVRPSVSGLGAKAAELALERAGIEPEHIGLLIADGSTPVETCPSQATQIGYHFNLKAPAYDLNGGGASLSNVLASLQAWKRDRVPDYILFVVSNAFTHRCNYRNSEAGIFFGDGASAFVLSPTSKGPLRVESARLFQGADSDGIGASGRPHAVQLSAFSHFSVTIAEAEACIDDRLQLILPHFSGFLSSDTCVVLSTITGGQLVRAQEALRLDTECVWNSVAEVGYVGSASPGCEISRRWDSLPGGKRILIADATLGAGCGTTVLSEEENY